MKPGLSLRNLLLVAGLLATATLAVALVRTRAERVELAARAAAIARETVVLEQRASQLRQDAPIQAETRMDPGLRAAILLAPAERARPVVGALVARFKAEHAAHPRPTPLPPPPTPPEGGMVFIELMDNPDYARVAFLLHRYSVEREHRRQLEAMGCDPGVVREAIDLLTEREMLYYDIHSLNASANGATEQKLRQDLYQQLRRLLGDDRYRQMEEPGMEYITTTKPDGTIEQTARPGIPTVPEAAIRRYLVGTLANRLSYSETPLAAAQVEALINALARLASGENRGKMSIDRWSEPEMSAALRSVLKPGQMAAVGALQAESAAYAIRAKLPQK